ncbi:hypothetical protein SEA_TOOJ_74 [Mycobacterium phage Tooj]|nr:hypothetical protein SEA_TOOJ_74 [Mycobacterium phage Tooj]
MMSFDATVRAAATDLKVGDTLTHEGRTYTVAEFDRRRRERPASWGGPYICTTIVWAEGYLTRLEDVVTV